MSLRAINNRAMAKKRSPSSIRFKWLRKGLVAICWHKSAPSPVIRAVASQSPLGVRSRHNILVVSIKSHDHRGNKRWLIASRCHGLSSLWDAQIERMLVSLCGVIKPGTLARSLNSDNSTVPTKTAQDSATHHGVVIVSNAHRKKLETS